MRKLALILALGLVLAACAGDVSETFEEIGSGLAGGEPGEASVPESAAAIDDSAARVDVEFDVATDRKVIRRANLALQADDTRKAFDEITSLAEASGGFVANANVYPVEEEGGHPRVVMTLRIPADQLNAVMSAIKGSVEEVISESQGADDVTEQYVDLEARLTNLRALEVELRALLEEVRKQPNADPEKLLQVYNEISSTRGQIEQIQGQLNYLDDVVSLATLDVSLAPTPAVVPIVEDTWEPIEVARDALRSLVGGLQDVADWAINFALFTLPMLLLTLAIPLTAGFLFYRRWRKNRTTAPPSEPTPAES